MFLCVCVGAIVRRLVGRTISQQIGKEVEQATAPFQYVCVVVQNRYGMCGAFNTISDVQRPFGDDFVD